MLLEVSNIVAGLSMKVTPFDEHGWEQRARQSGWIEPGILRARNYREKGGQESAVDAVEGALGLPRDDAERIVAEMLSEWSARVTPEELADSRAGRRFVFVFFGFLAALLAGFIALLVVVLVTLVF